MSSKRYLTAKEAAAQLGVSVSTLYAYVSRGLIRSEQSAEGKRTRRYYAEDIEKLLARKEGRRNPEKLAKDALHWGAPVMDSAITLIEGGNYYYRGQDVTQLAQNHAVEDVATLIWTGTSDGANTLFDVAVHISAQKYETMLLHMEVDGIFLTPIQELQSFLPAAQADDPAAYDLRPATVAATGARILRLMASIVAGDVPENLPIAVMLQQGWCPQDERAIHLFDAALILMGDHELNASSFTARVVASSGATPYAVVMAGLSSLQGIKHGGYVEQVSALFNEAQTPDQIHAVMRERLRRGDSIPGFGHKLYPDGDPRAKTLIDLLRRHYADSPEMQFAEAALQAAKDLINDAPSVDTALVILSRVLGLPKGSALALFALGRTIGWIGHAIEQYDKDRIIRPRARYIGEHPET